jgi:ABC-type phosphate transport system auxiliary subunit
MKLSALSKTTGISERTIRRAVEQLTQSDGLTLSNGEVAGPDLPYLLATLDELKGMPASSRLPVVERFRELKARGSNQSPAASGSAGQAGTGGEQQVQQALAELRQAIANLEKNQRSQQDDLHKRLVALEERFARVNRAMTAIELTLEDEDADNNLYNILVGHIGAFNHRLTRNEQYWGELGRGLTAAYVKLADDKREIRNLLRELIALLSPK